MWFGGFWGVVWWVLGCGLVGFGVWFGGFWGVVWWVLGCGLVGFETFGNLS